MNTKFVILMFIGTILTITVYSSSKNFVSAADECFGTSSQGYVICTYEYRNNINGEVSTRVQECVKGADGNWDCHTIGAKVMPPGLQGALKKSLASDDLGKATTGTADGTNSTGTFKEPGKLEHHNLKN